MFAVVIKESGKLAEVRLAGSVSLELVNGGWIKMKDLPFEPHVQSSSVPVQLIEATYEIKETG